MYCSSTSCVSRWKRILYTPASSSSLSDEGATSTSSSELLSTISSSCTCRVTSNGLLAGSGVELRSLEPDATAFAGRSSRLGVEVDALDAMKDARWAGVSGGMWT